MPLLMPKKYKFRKSHRGRRKGTAQRGAVLSFGDYGLQALGECWLTASQIEAARVAINRKVKRSGRLWIRVFPDKPISKKPAETRMGKGKGDTEAWVAVIKPRRVLFEIEGVERNLAKEAMRSACYKLPVKTKFLEKEAGE